jgi:hypothetical protein
MNYADLTAADRREFNQIRREARVFSQSEDILPENLRFQGVTRRRANRTDRRAGTIGFP